MANAALDAPDSTSKAQVAARLRQRQERRQLTLLLGPAAFWLLAFFLLPLAIVLVYSFLKRGTYGGIVAEFNLQNYVRLLDRDHYLIFRRSVWLALVTTIICLVSGYPLAYFIARRPARWRGVLLLLVIVPFWTNFLVRTYAWMTILRNEGVINVALSSLGIISEPLRMLFTPEAVIIGMIYGYLPFMVLPLYAALERFDFSLMEAAYDAGANHARAFLRVMIPLTMPGIVAGCILVFIPSIGAFVTPDILGGAKTMMIGNLIERQFTSARDWPFASAVSIGLMVLVSLSTALYFRVTGEADRA